jgi:hypothetical protein
VVEMKRELEEGEEEREQKCRARSVDDRYDHA